MRSAGCIARPVSTLKLSLSRLIFAMQYKKLRNRLNYALGADPEIFGGRGCNFELG